MDCSSDVTMSSPPPTLKGDSLLSVRSHNHTQKPCQRYVSAYITLQLATDLFYFLPSNPQIGIFQSILQIQVNVKDLHELKQT